MTPEKAALSVLAQLIRRGPDPRPQLGSWAPGDYLGKCSGCRQHFVGDKHALSCADCAYSSEAVALCSTPDFRGQTAPPQPAGEKHHCTPDLDALALECAKAVERATWQRAFAGGDIQIRAARQCAIEEVLQKQLGDTISLPQAGVEQIRAAIDRALTDLHEVFEDEHSPGGRSIDSLRAALAILPPPTEPGTSWPLGPPVETTSEPQPPCPMCGNPASAHTPRFDEGLGVEALVCPEEGR